MPDFMPSNDWLEESLEEGNYTPQRPPQYNDRNLPSSSFSAQATGTRAIPRTSPHTRLEGLLGSDGTAALSVPVRDYISGYTDGNYASAQQQDLTESAINRLENEFAMSSYPRTVADWVGTGPQHPPLVNPPSRAASWLCSPGTEPPRHTTSIGSSWAMLSTSTPFDAAQTDHQVCAAGYQFQDVIVPRTEALIIEEPAFGADSPGVLRSSTWPPDQSRRPSLNRQS
ncbi:hypothetical protein F5Y17DRAFT_397651 [Xylariaceae sp. FL0594]|nr:hypothetical protein F5Y17DRAFT_397651 [Xylariaceae sp. FL0594]